MGHYIFNAFREKENRWYVLDDLCTAALPSKRFMQNVIIHHIIYLKSIN